MKASANILFERFLYILIDQREIKPFRIEIATGPGLGGSMILMGWISHRFEKIFITGNPADILGRAGRRYRLQIVEPSRMPENPRSLPSDANRRRNHSCR